MRIETGHNPFARETVTKRQEEGCCDNCGGHNRKGKVFVYMVERDGISAAYTRPQDIRGKFCCIGCLNSYYGE